MSTTTSNLGLIKPELTDAADITATNENWDKLDTTLTEMDATLKEIDEKQQELEVLTPEDISAAPLSRIMYGCSTNIKDYALTLDQGLYAVHFTGETYTGTDLPTGNYRYGSAIIYVRIKNKVVTIMLLGTESSPPQFAHCNDGTWGEWSTQFLPLTGGLIRGNLDFKKVDNGSATIYKNHGGTADYGLIIRDVANDGSYSQLALCAAENALKYRDTSGKIGNIYGDHNKPKGTYTGNRSETKRTIQVGGRGNVVVVIPTSEGHVMDYISFITPYGACTINNSTQVFYNNVYLDSDMNIVMTTSVQGLNGQNTTYQYYLL